MLIQLHTRTRYAPHVAIFPQGLYTPTAVDIIIQTLQVYKVYNSYNTHLSEKSRIQSLKLNIYAKTLHIFSDTVDLGNKLDCAWDIIVGY
jgi:hypothetical protein